MKQAQGDPGGIGIEGTLDRYDSILYFVLQKLKPPTPTQRVVQGALRNDYTMIQVYITIIHKVENVKVLQIDNQTGNASFRDTGVGPATGSKLISFSQLRGDENLGEPTVKTSVS